MAAVTSTSRFTRVYEALFSNPIQHPEKFACLTKTDIAITALALLIILGGVGGLLLFGGISGLKFAIAQPGIISQGAAVGIGIASGIATLLGASFSLQGLIISIKSVKELTAGRKKAQEALNPSPDSFGSRRIPNAY